MKRLLVLIMLVLLTACSCKTTIDKESILHVEQTQNKKITNLKKTRIYRLIFAQICATLFLTKTVKI